MSPPRKRIEDLRSQYRFASPVAAAAAKEVLKAWEAERDALIKQSSEWERYARGLKVAGWKIARRCAQSVRIELGTPANGKGGV